MASSDRQTIETEVKYALGNRTDIDTNLTQWVKRAYQHLTQALEFPEALVTSTIDTVVATRTFSLPANYFSMYNVHNLTRSKALLQVGITEYDRFNIVETGAADRYAILGMSGVVPNTTRDMGIHPTPSTIETIQIRYRKVFAELTDPTTIHELPSVWDQPIVQLATAYGFESTNDIGRAAFYHNRVQAFVLEQSQRLAGDLYDRNEAMSVVGGEIF